MTDGLRAELEHKAAPVAELRHQREARAAPLIAWSRAFPAAPAQVREARRFPAGILDGRPAADNAILRLSELVTNASLHSRSREPGGHVTVRAQIHGRRLRVEVCDQGGPWAQPARTGEQNGRGLLIIGKLARTWGHTADETGRTAWFTIVTAARHLLAGTAEAVGPDTPAPVLLDYLARYRAHLAALASLSHGQQAGGGVVSGGRRTGA
ncbi:MAG TPA: ATP-binding protein [Streptosporangiaceae bacterium]|nr:ATP-binding protein [Streptosporangiaceae bacterium]